jgi:coxsackievirus/adenovirus receptor
LFCNHNTEAKSIESDYPGSYCTLENGTPRCICETISCQSDNIKVCAEDGQTYASFCDLMKLSCSTQIPIKVRYSGQCSQGI